MGTLLLGKRPAKIFRVIDPRRRPRAGGSIEEPLGLQESHEQQEPGQLRESEEPQEAAPGKGRRFAYATLLAIAIGLVATSIYAGYEMIKSDDDASLAEVRSDRLRPELSGLNMDESVMDNDVEHVRAKPWWLDNCGQRSLTITKLNSSKDLEGSIIDIKSAPWTVGLLINGQWGTGVLIGERHVLTDTNLIKSRDWSKSEDQDETPADETNLDRVLYGTKSENNVTQTKETTIQKCFTHPKWSKSKPEYNIAVCRMDRIELDQDVAWPICLPSVDRESDLSDDVNCENTASVPDPNSLTLLGAESKIIRTSDKGIIYSNSKFCPGNNGGPLFCEEEAENRTRSVAFGLNFDGDQCKTETESEVEQRFAPLLSAVEWIEQVSDIPGV